MPGPGEFFDAGQDGGQHLGFDGQHHHRRVHHLGAVQGGRNPQLIHLGLPGRVRVVVDQVFPGHKTPRQQPPDDGAAHVADADETQLYFRQPPFPRFCH